MIGDEMVIFMNLVVWLWIEFFYCMICCCYLFARAHLFHFEGEEMINNVIIGLDCVSCFVSHGQFLASLCRCAKTGLQKKIKISDPMGKAFPRNHGKFSSFLTLFPA